MLEPSTPAIFDGEFFIYEGMADGLRTKCLDDIAVTTEDEHTKQVAHVKPRRGRAKCLDKLSESYTPEGQPTSKEKPKQRWCNYVLQLQHEPNEIFAEDGRHIEL